MGNFAENLNLGNRVRPPCNKDGKGGRKPICTIHLLVS